MAYDGLHDIFTDQPMGALTEQRNDVDSVTRAEQDAFAARSHQKAAAAWKDGVFDDEVVPVSIPQRKGDPIVFTEDEGIRADTTAESLAKLRPAFRKDGTITAGSASQISDGAAAVVVMSKAKAAGARADLDRARSAPTASSPGPDSTLQSQPAHAIAKALRAKEGIDPTDLDLIEINEAFAAVGIASTQELGVDPAKVNVNGGAIADRAPDRHVRRPHRPAPRPRTARRGGGIARGRALRRPADKATPWCCARGRSLRQLGGAQAA